VAEIVIIAGPNGAGKTTFAREYLIGSKGSWPFVNADEIVEEISNPLLPQASRLADTTFRTGSCADGFTRAFST
jgi:predicted ABC-type ATPase